MNKLEIYTDGSCKGNPGNGGWAFVAVKDSKEIHRCANSVSATTNNRMELTALIRALEWLKLGNQNLKLWRSVVVYSDSAYLVNGVNDWLINWKKKNWRKADKKPVENKDLWQIVDERYTYLRGELNGQLSVEWVEGHANNGFNNLADELAQQASGGFEPKLGYGSYPHVFHVVVGDELAKTVLENFIMLESAKGQKLYIDFAQSQLSFDSEKE